MPVETGEIDPGFSGAARVVEAEYEWPFQPHASVGWACAVVDARADEATLSTGSQRPHFARNGRPGARVAARQGPRHLRPGPGYYGRSDAGDAGIDAEFLSKAVGRPLRVQGVRCGGTAGTRSTRPRSTAPPTRRACQARRGESEHSCRHSTFRRPRRTCHARALRRFRQQGLLARRYRHQ